jgi:hypothetical protein
MKLHAKQKKHKRVLSPKHSKLLARLQKIQSNRTSKDKRRPMATPIREPLGRKNVFSWFSGFYRYTAKHVYLTVLIIVLAGLSYILFFSNILVVKDLDIQPESALACVSRDSLKKEILDKRTFIGSHFFFNEEDFKKKNPCLKNITVSWSPLEFNTFKVSLTTLNPVLKVVVETVDSVDRTLMQDRMYDLPVLKEDIRYASTNGALIPFQGNISLIETKYRVFKDTSVQSLNLGSEYVTFIYQLREYLSNEFTYDPVLDSAIGGTVKTSAPFADALFFTSRLSLGGQLNSLQAVLKHVTINKSKIEAIDLRFGNPVIRYKK